LKKKGVKNFKILEAKNYVGGRAHTVVETWEGQKVPLDLGAMWLQNGANNLLTDYAKKYKIKHSVSKFNTKLYFENNGGPIDDDDYDELYDELYEQGFYPLQASRQKRVGSDESLKTSAGMFVNSISDPLKRKLAKQFIRDTIELEYSGSLEEMSLLHWNSDSWIGGEDSDDFFVLDGYSALVKAYASDENLMDNVVLEASVTNVNYEDNEKVRIAYKDKDHDIVSLTAKKVIITVPLGVLQNNLIKFEPILPLSTSRCIQRLGMGKMNKIFMFWNSDDVFWPGAKEYEVLGDATDRDSTFLFYNSLSFNGDKPAMYAFFKGPEVEELEKQYAKSDPEEYKRSILELAMICLRSMFGNDIPSPQKVLLTNWNVDEHTMGAYSFNKCGMKVADREILRSPIGNNRIYITGEAAHDNYFATTTGAFLAGRATAKEVARRLKQLIK